jgi:hypothetical protein
LSVQPKQAKTIVHTHAELSQRACTNPQVSTERALVSEQLELLQRENDLLIQQQRELGREVKRLQAALDIKSREVLTAANSSLDMQVGSPAALTCPAGRAWCMQRFLALQTLPG